MKVLLINNLPESWREGSLNIDDNINARSTASFVVFTNNPLAVGQEVIITDAGTRIFGGTIDSFTKTNPKGTNLVKYDITAVDFNQIGDRRRVAETYENKTVGFIVNDLITKYLLEEGITAGNITTGNIISKAVFNYITVTQALDYIKDVTGLNWNIDYHKQLHIFAREDNTDTGFSDDLGNYLDIELEKTREEYRNRQIIRAGQDTTDVITKETPTPKPDGESRIFKVRYPVATKPLIFINDIEVDGDDIGINGLDYNKKWYWNKNSKDIVQDEQEPVLTTETIAITYQGLVPIIVQADNPQGQDSRALIEGGTGIYEELENKPSIDEKDTAFEYAQGLLRKFADIPERVRINTREFKQAGKLIPIKNNILGINADYLIESVTITENGGRFFYSIICLSGESLGTWVEFFRKLRDTGQDYVIRENEVLVLLNSTTERMGWSDELDIKVYACPVPSEELYPQGLKWQDLSTQTWDGLGNIAWQELQPDNAIYPC